MSCWLDEGTCGVALPPPVASVPQIIMRKIEFGDKDGHAYWNHNLELCQ